MEEIKECLICGTKDFKIHLQTEDYFLTKEKFTIVTCPNCGFRFLNPRPISKELGRYYESPQYISHSNSKTGLTNILYQIIRQFTLRKKFTLVNRLVSSGKNILDIGCATGEFLNEFQNHGWSSHGIEPNKNAREFARKNYGLDIRPEEEITDYKNDSFDVITMWHVLEHVAALPERIDEIVRLLKNDGVLLVAVPNSDSFDANYYGKFWAAYDVPRHLYHFSPVTIKRLFEKHGFILQKSFPMKFDAFYVSLLSEKYKNGKINYFKALWKGMQSNLHARKDNNYSSLIFVFKFAEKRN